MAAAAPGPRLYCPRRPERTLLYRALAGSFERFLGVYEKRFEPTHGYLRRAVAPAVYRYLDCGIFAHGAARAHCAECGHDVLIAFSCKLRCLCPSCHQKRERAPGPAAKSNFLHDLRGLRNSDRPSGAKP